MVDKEAYAIVSAFLRLPQMFWDAAHLFCNHWNLTYIFHSEACALPTMSKATAQRLQRWSAFLG